MKRFASFVTVFSALTLMLGCESSGGGKQKDVTTQAADGVVLRDFSHLTDTKTGLPIEPKPARLLGYVPNWAVNLDLPKGQSISSVTVLEPLGLAVVVERPTNLVSGISLRDGSIVWRQVIGTREESIFRAHVVNESQLLVNSEKRAFVLAAADGRIEGLSNLMSTVVSDPVVVGQYAIFGGRNGQVFAHDLNAGFTKWAYKLNAAILTGPVQSGANNVFVADSTGSYAMFDGTDGTLLWKNRTWGAVTAQPQVALAGVYVACRDSALYSFNRTTGLDNWIYRVTRPLTAPPFPVGRLILQPVPGDGIHAVSASDGTLQWKLVEDVTPIRMVGDAVLVHGESGLQLLSVEDGAVVESVPTLPLVTVELGPDNSLILVTPTGRLMRLNPML